MGRGPEYRTTIQPRHITTADSIIVPTRLRLMAVMLAAATLAVAGAGTVAEEEAETEEGRAGNTKPLR